MSKVILSNGYEFTLADNGYTGDDASVSLTIICNDKTLEEIETIFTDVDEFDVVLGEGEEVSYLAKYYGYTTIKELAKLPQYSNGVDPETGKEFINTAYMIICIKKSVEERLSDIEEAIDDLIAIIFEEDDLFPDDEDPEPEPEPEPEPDPEPGE